MHVPLHPLAPVARVAVALLAALSLACGSSVKLDDPAAQTPTARADGEIPEPFPFTQVGAAYVGVSGSYPYILLYEDPFTCEQITSDGGSAIADITYENILILVGGWEEGTYPVFDVLGSTGAYSLDGQAIAYMTQRTGRTINELSYARGGALTVTRISDVTQTVRGSFQLDFESGTLSGDFVIGDYCDVY